MKKFFHLTILSSIILSGVNCVSAQTAEGEKEIDPSIIENHRNPAVDFYLEKRKIALPEGDFLLIATQPNGNVGSAVLIEFETNEIRLLHGTHSRKEEQILSLREEDGESLISLLQSEAINELPAQSGKYGFDGWSLVVYFRCNGVERFLSHWAPDNDDILVFRELLDRYFEQIRKEESMFERPLK